MNPFDTSNVYTPITYEEMVKVKQEAAESEKKYRQAYKNFLITCLCEAGFAKKIVRHKKSGCEGILEIEERSYHRPYEIKFFPVKKNGGISLKAKFCGLTSDNRLVQDLTDLFELVEGTNAS